MKNVVHASGGSNAHETPLFLYNYFHNIFSFNVDVAASHTNHLCDRYFTEEDDALKQDWGSRFRAWNNCPYSGDRIQDRFVEKTVKELRRAEDALAMLLIPFRPETSRWRRFIWPTASEIYIPDERLHFSYAPNGAGFPSAFVYLNSDGCKNPVLNHSQYELERTRPNIFILRLKELPGYRDYKQKIKENRLKLELDVNNQGSSGICSDVTRVATDQDWERGY